MQKHSIFAADLMRYKYAHIEKDGHEAKYNVVPEVTQVYNHGFKKHEISMIEGVIEENVEVITARWKEYFKDKK